MPTSTPARRARWGDDATAIKFLVRLGYKLTPEWEWERPPHRAIGAPSWKEYDAIMYLIEEYDFGGLAPYLHHDPLGTH